MSARATTGPSVKVGGSVRRWLSRAGTVGAVAVSACSAMVAVSFAATAAEQDGTPNTGLYVLATLVGLTLAGALVLRRRHAVALCVVASAASILLPIDSSAALLTLPWVVATASVRTSAACTVLTGAATGAALARDALRDPGDMVFAVVDQPSGAVTSRPGSDAVMVIQHPGASAFVVIGVALLAASLAVGLARRSRATAARAREQQEAQASVTAVLRDQMTRQEERELIAREVHDTVAHHIAAISLQASALEVMRTDDSEVSGTAREVRASAQQAIAELRTLLATLRSGDQDGVVLPGTSLDDLAPLLEQLRHDGARLTSTVFVSGADQAPPPITRATFRIVQEAVTNALKHAPGQPVDVAVRAAPVHGVSIRVSNPLPDARSSQERVVLGTGSGILGMRERAEAVGGRLDAGAADGRFGVAASLPWDAPAAGEVARG
ncbi:sensor histidine kinase [Isoptericola cucumis]|nr:histidine kinase [Isoptericola cucumis]